jgi:hypothetical protein
MSMIDVCSGARSIKSFMRCKKTYRIMCQLHGKIQGEIFSG